MKLLPITLCLFAVAAKLRSSVRRLKRQEPRRSHSPGRSNASAEPGGEGGLSYGGISRNTTAFKLLIASLLVPLTSLQAADALRVSILMDGLNSLRSKIMARSSLTLGETMSSNCDFTEQEQIDLLGILVNVCNELNTKASIDQVDALTATQQQRYENLLTLLQTNAPILSQQEQSHKIALENLTAVYGMRFTEFGKSIAELETNLTNLQQRITALNNQKASADSHNALATKVNALEEKIIAIKNHLTTLQLHTEHASACINDLTTKVTAATDQANEATKLVNALDLKNDLTQQQLNTAKNEFQNLHLVKRVNDLIAEHDETKKLVDAITKKVDLALDNATQHKISLNVTDNRVNDLEARLERLNHTLDLVTTYGSILGKTTAGHAVSAQCAIVQKLLEKIESTTWAKQAAPLTDVIGIFLTKQNFDCAATSALLNGITTKADGSLDYSWQAALKNGASHLLTFAVGNLLSKVASDQVANVPAPVKEVATIAISTLIQVQFFNKSL